MADSKKKYYRKHPELHPLINKIKLWPSRTGILHGIKSVNLRGDIIEAETHCGNVFRTRNSRKSRAARWLRNKWAADPCKKCKVPEWKLTKYTNTFFSQHYGKVLKPEPVGDVFNNKSGGDLQNVTTDYGMD